MYLGGCGHLRIPFSSKVLELSVLAASSRFPQPDPPLGRAVQLAAQFPGDRAGRAVGF